VPSLGATNPEQDVDERRLARAVRPEEPEGFAGVDGKIDAVESEHVAVTLREVRGADDCHGTPRRHDGA
jgi:hypothetical protein